MNHEAFLRRKELSRGFVTLKKAPSAPDLLHSLLAHSPSMTSSSDTLHTREMPHSPLHKRQALDTFTVGVNASPQEREAEACKGDGWQRKKKIREKQQLWLNCAAARKAEGQKVNYATELEAVALQNGNRSLHHEGRDCI